MVPVATTLSFQPWHALVAGMSLGVISMGRMLIAGRVLGISGIVKGLCAGKFETWRNSFVVGLVMAGFVASSSMPGAFDALPDSYSYARATLAGLCVGAGSTLGNGCTSGHGISGNARLSARSFAYTCTFFVAGIVACVLGNTVSALGVAQSAPTYLALQGLSAERAMTLIVTAIAGTFGFGAVAYKTKKQNVSVAFDLFAGLAFGLALSFSGMTRPTLVATALAALQPAWNFTLFFVMGGALLVAVPMYHVAIRKRTTALDGSALDLPKSTVVDAQLLLGGVLFGAGWGVGGMCPGPAVVALASAQPKGAALVAAMLAGMAGVQQWQRSSGRPRTSTRMSSAGGETAGQKPAAQ